MRFATEPTIVRLPASVDDMATVAFRGGQARHERFEDEHRRHVADEIGQYRCDQAEQRQPIEMEATDCMYDFGSEHRLLEPCYDDKQTHEHQEQGPIDPVVNLLRFYTPGKQKERARDQSSFRRGLPCETGTITAVIPTDLMSSAGCTCLASG